MQLGYGNSLIGQNRPRGASFVGALDAFTADLTVAWSLNRRLLTSYTGPLGRVRRSSDSEQADFYAGTDGLVDKAALVTFADGSDLFVTAAYAQFGSLDFTNATAIFQAQIASSGVLAEDGTGLAPKLPGGPGLGTSSIDRQAVFGTDSGLIIQRYFEQAFGVNRSLYETLEDVHVWATIGNTLYFDYGGQTSGRVLVAPPSGWENVWHWLRCGRDAGTQNICVDGVELVTGSKSASNSAGTTNLTIPYGANNGCSECVIWSNGANADAKEAALIGV